VAKVPGALSHLNTRQVLGGSSFFRPLWDNLQYLFEGRGEKWIDNFGVHLWESISWERYLKKLTVRYIEETRKYAANCPHAAARCIKLSHFSPMEHVPELTRPCSNFNDLVVDLLPSRR
jgi:hypothetical protein